MGPLTLLCNSISSTSLRLDSLAASPSTDSFFSTQERIGRSYLRNARVPPSPVEHRAARSSSLILTIIIIIPHPPMMMMIIPHPPTTAEATKASFCAPWVRSTHLTSFCNIRQNGGGTTEKLPSSLFYSFHCWKSDSVKDFN